MKRGLTIVLAVCLILALCACERRQDRAARFYASPSVVEEVTASPDPAVAAALADVTAPPDVDTEDWEALKAAMANPEGCKQLTNPESLDELRYLTGPYWMQIDDATTDTTRAYVIPTPDRKVMSISIAEIHTTAFSAAGLERVGNISKAAFENSDLLKRIGIESLDPVTGINAEYAWMGDSADSTQTSQAIVFGDANKMYVLVCQIPNDGLGAVDEIWLPFMQTMTYNGHPVLQE